MDDKLRRLENQAEKGDDTAGAALLVERIRAGDLAIRSVMVAAIAGNAHARLTLEHLIPVWAPDPQWIATAIRFHRGLVWAWSRTRLAEEARRYLTTTDPRIGHASDTALSASDIPTALRAAQFLDQASEQLLGDFHQEMVVAPQSPPPFQLLAASRACQGIACFARDDHASAVSLVVSAASITAAGKQEESTEHLRTRVEKRLPIEEQRQRDSLSKFALSQTQTYPFSDAVLFGDLLRQSALPLQNDPEIVSRMTALSGTGWSSVRQDLLQVAEAPRAKALPLVELEADFEFAPASSTTDRITARAKVVAEWSTDRWVVVNKLCVVRHAKATRDTRASLRGTSTLSASATGTTQAYSSPIASGPLEALPEPGTVLDSNGEPIAGLDPLSPQALAYDDGMDDANTGDDQ